MAYREDGYKGNSKWVGIVVGVLMLGYCTRLAGIGADNIRLDSPERAEAALLTDPSAGALFATIKRTHPGEFDGLKNAVMQRAIEGASDDMIAEAALDFLIAAGKRHRASIAQAPDREFAAYRAAELEVVESLASNDVANCADYVIRGAMRVANGSADLERKTIAFRQSSWEASAAGRDTPAHRKIAAPSPDDWRDIAALMTRNGLSPVEAAIFFDDKAITEAAADLQCRTGLSYFRAINALPAERANEFYAFLVSQSV